MRTIYFHLVVAEEYNAIQVRFLVATNTPYSSDGNSRSKSNPAQVKKSNQTSWLILLVRYVNNIFQTEAITKKCTLMMIFPKVLRKCDRFQKVRPLLNHMVKGCTLKRSYIQLHFYLEFPYSSSINECQKSSNDSSVWFHFGFSFDLLLQTDLRCPHWDRLKYKVTTTDTLLFRSDYRDFTRA